MLRCKWFCSIGILEARPEDISSSGIIFVTCRISQATKQIRLSPDSTWDQTNPWLPIRESVLDKWQPEGADIWFPALPAWTFRFRS